MAKTQGQINIEINVIKTKCRDILKHLENLKKEGIYEVEYIEKYIKEIENFKTKAEGDDGLRVRSDNYFKAKK
ncbi:hypothetical protein [Flavobacterium sp. CAU 1735]|uniref:hypothetical protein n=1 Tax=Flavobacterium sp. CAU 1735 TaxID=3140361 RepID=UPI0032602193